MTDRRKPETILQGQIMATLAGLGVWVIRIGRVKRRPGLQAPECGEDGIPDLWTELGWIEVKEPGKGLDPDQETWHAKAVRRGVSVGVAHSVREAVELVNGWRKARAA